MRKITIIFGSLIAVFLMLMIPNISAIEYRTTNKETTPTYEPYIDEEELKDAILERIEQLREQQKDIAIQGLNWTDPDGPLEGGLDDWKDIIGLFLGLYFSGCLTWSMFKGLYRNSQPFIDRLIVLISNGVITIQALILLGEAFDVYDMTPSDGC